MTSLSSTLQNAGARSFIQLPGKMTVEEGARRIVQNLAPAAKELVVVLLARPRSEIQRVAFFQTAQLNQAILQTLLVDPNRLLIFEAAAPLGQLLLPRELGRVLVLGTDFKTLEELTETARFLSGPALQGAEIRPLDLTRYLGQIGNLLCDSPAPSPCTQLNFSYEGIPQTVPMTQSQYYEYLTRIQRERGIGRREPFSALQTTNFIYPLPLQQLHNVPREQRPTLPSDLLISEGGWLTSEILNDLPERSPKLAWAVQYLRLNPGKHIIWTQFNESNGVQVISSVLSLAGFEVVNVTGTDPLPQRYRKVEEFNRADAGTKVFVSNLYAFTGFQSITSLIMFEQHPSDAVFNSYLRQIATSSEQGRLSAIFLVSTGPNGEETVEVSNYLTMIGAVNSRDTILTILKSGEVLRERLELYRTVFQLPSLTLQDLRTAIPRTFGRIVLN